MAGSARRAGQASARGRREAGADHLRQAIAAKGALAVIPNNPSKGQSVRSGLNAAVEIGITKLFKRAKGR